MPAIQIMIAESDPGQLQLLSAVLGKRDDINVVSTVSTRETAIKQLMTSRPDIMILNPEVLKEHTLSRFIRSVQDKSPHTRILFLLKKAPADENIISDIKTGIRGYIKTTDQPAIMIKAIHAVHEGEIWAGRRILEKAISKPMLLPETLQANVPGLPPLTNREMEMLTLVLQGASNKEIADRSSISERTVKTHLYRVYRKLKVKSRTKAIALLSHS
ncbi:MAG TPA: response regulator transcription factor [Nitrospirota bacterium]